MMKRIAEGATRIFLACGTTDFRKRIPGLVAAVTLSFKLDPYNGDYVFIFCNRKRDSIKHTRKNGMTEHEELLMLRALAAKQAQELEASKRIIAERDEKIRKQNIQIDNLIQALLHARKKLFGPSSRLSNV